MLALEKHDKEEEEKKEKREPIQPDTSSKAAKREVKVESLKDKRRKIRERKGNTWIHNWQRKGTK
ncbi:hypothetical protein L873DRAFT_1811127 [Choiromyces venosus 120613-1]|uniref:Uncharacterized protein n=1 Tax=Choiromyces venosus 120613-1 TaxID=1336337 RepID=A0A3N4JE28_9PEZI|nr:hypothetical protein L873DRAFT_1811127 [Choiromyces venosus 120613-1]